MKILIEIDTDTQRVVPVEPTEEMAWVAARHYESNEYTGVRSTYKAMLAAAPQSEPVYVDLRRDAERVARSRGTGGWQTLEDMVIYAEALVAELAKENKPFCFVFPEIADSFIKVSCGTAYRKRSSPEQIALYTLPPTAEKIEQETTEAIAKHFEQQPYVEHFGDNIAEAVRSGAWKECK